MNMSYSASPYSILVVLEEQTTLYMRPAAMLAKIANQFESDVVVEYEKVRANGKSLLDMITLGISTGSNFKILASGKDALKAIQAIRDFFSRFLVDGEINETTAEKRSRFVKHKDIRVEQKDEEKMKQKKRTAAKHVEQDNAKAQTFTWPLGNVKEVSLAGDFNNWKPEPMTKCENGFQSTVKLEPGIYQYKFVVDGQWQADPSANGSAQNDFGTTNSVLLVD